MKNKYTVAIIAGVAFFGVVSQTVEAGGAAFRIAAKEAIKQASKQTAKQQGKQVAKKGVQQAAKSGANKPPTVTMKQVKEAAKNSPKTVETIPSYPPSKIPSGKPGPMHTSQPSGKLGKVATATAAAAAAKRVVDKANEKVEEARKVFPKASPKPQPKIQSKPVAKAKPKPAPKAKPKPKPTHLDRPMPSDFIDRFDRNNDGKVEFGIDIPDRVHPGSIDA